MRDFFEVVDRRSATGLDMLQDHAEADDVRLMRALADQLVGGRSHSAPSPSMLREVFTKGATTDRRSYSLPEMKRIGVQADGGAPEMDLARLEKIGCARKPLQKKDAVGAEQMRKGRKRPRAEFLSDPDTGVLHTTDVVITGEDAHADFEQLMLPAAILTALKKCGFVKPSPVQLRAIPIGRLGVDLIAQAKSGTGKTIVFCIIALETVLAKKGPSTPLRRKPSVLVLTPTREIALQVGSVAHGLTGAMEEASHRISVHVFIGGVQVTKDREALANGVDIAIGTPGRIKALLQDAILDASSICLVVLDEADKLLDGTFREAIPQIVRCMPDRRQVATFSATFSQQLLDTLKGVMRDPQLISLAATASSTEASAVLKGVHQQKVVVSSTADHVHRIRLAAAVLATSAFHQCVVFYNDKSRGRMATAMFTAAGFSTAFTSGDEPQRNRRAVMDAVRNETTRVLVATDLMARGVDIPNCNLVINLDLPKSFDDYLHRVGRAGRFGTKGASVIIGTDADIVPIESHLSFELEDLDIDARSLDIDAPDVTDNHCDHNDNDTNGMKYEDNPVARQPIVDNDKVLPVTSNDRKPCTPRLQNTEREDSDRTKNQEQVKDDAFGQEPLASEAIPDNGVHDAVYYSEDWICYWEAYAKAYRLAKEYAYEHMRGNC